MFYRNLRNERSGRPGGTCPGVDIYPFTGSFDADGAKRGHHENSGYGVVSIGEGRHA